MSRVGTQVSAPHPFQHPPPPHRDPFICQPSQLQAQEGTPSEPHFPYQVPSNFRLQILPGDEIVQVNEQVVVSERERDLVGMKGLLSRTQGWWVRRDSRGNQGCGRYLT